MKSAKTLHNEKVVKLDIKTLERYSGIKAHTIRAWEQRFKVFEPSRTAGNRRFYGADELKMLLDFSVLNRYGTSISKLLQFSPDDIRHKIGLLKNTGAKKDIVLNQLVLAYVASDIVSFESLLSEYALEHSAHKCAVDVIIPFIECVGLYGYINQRPSTHFVVTAIRKKLHQASETVIDSHSAYTALLFLPANQHFDLLLLLMAYLLEQSGVRVLYLGTNVAGNSLKNVVEQYQPDVLISYLVPGRNADDLNKLQAIGSEHKNLYVGTAPGEELPLSSGLRSVCYRDIAASIKSQPRF